MAHLGINKSGRKYQGSEWCHIFDVLSVCDEGKVIMSSLKTGKPGGLSARTFKGKMQYFPEIISLKGNIIS